MSIVKFVAIKTLTEVCKHILLHIFPFTPINVYVCALVFICVQK